MTEIMKKFPTESGVGGHERTTMFEGVFSSRMAADLRSRALFPRIAWLRTSEAPRPHPGDFGLDAQFGPQPTSNVGRATFARRFSGRTAVRSLVRGSLLGMLFCIVGSAQAAIKSDYGRYVPHDIPKAQTYLNKAMTGPMETLVRDAADIKADKLFLYGLALAIGRPPATDSLGGVARDRVQGLFRELLTIYVKQEDGVRLSGSEPGLLAQADYWILMGRVLTVTRRQVTDFNNTTMGSNGGVSATTGGTMISESGGFKAPDGPVYTLKGDAPVLDPGPVSAAQACAAYARATAKMRRVVALDPNAQLKIPIDQMKDAQSRAATILSSAQTLGIEACGGTEFFEKVVSFSAQHLGKLGEMKLTRDPVAADAAK